MKRWHGAFWLGVLLVAGGLSWGQPKPPPEKNRIDGSPLVAVPAGDFWMGLEADAVGDSSPEENPRHKVFTNRYLMTRYEVTNKQFENFVGATNHKPRKWNKEALLGRERHPATLVTWEDANAYARWVGGRLPSEAEWEKAARGTDERRYPWGNEWEPDFCNNSVDGPARSALPCGTYTAGDSPYGISDMAGNVLEWTADWFHPYAGSAVPDVPSYYKIVRGGGWRDRDKCYFRTTYRVYFPVDKATEDTGFRYVMDP